MRRILLVIAGLGVAAAAVFALRSPLAPGVFVEPDMPASERARLLSAIHQAEMRIPEYFGDRRAHPRILTRSTGTATYRTPLCDCTFLGPQGRDVDAIAHEMAHAELTARVGRWREIPTWFDEGMAMHVDLRPAYGEAAYRQATANGAAARPALPRRVRQPVAPRLAAGARRGDSASYCGCGGPPHQEQSSPSVQFMSIAW